MKKLCVISTLALLLVTGCSLSTTDKAIITANEIHAIAESERDIISSYCVPKYEEAKTDEDIKNADKVCLPARTAFYSTRAAWVTLSSIIEALKYGQASTQDVQDAMVKLTSALADLKKAMEDLK